MVGTILNFSNITTGTKIPVPAFNLLTVSKFLPVVTASVIIYFILKSTTLHRNWTLDATEFMTDSFFQISPV